MGIVFDIQRCCYHDGPGIRTTVFLKGCPLRCAWCHNPESFEAKPQLRFVESLCVHCDRCIPVCPRGVHTDANGVRAVDFHRCNACGRCAEVCPQDALSIVGKGMTVSEIMDIVVRDRIYYGDNGGLTVSGGEPTFQADFLTELLKAARKEKIHACLETNGYIPEKTLAKILPFTDLFLVDFKLTENEGLTSLTGAAGNLWEKTMDTLSSSGKPVVLRMPVIPGINDTEAHMKEAASIVSAYPNIRDIEIMPYHSIGADKWKQIGLDYSLKPLKSASPEQKDHWNTLLKKALESAGWRR